MAAVFANVGVEYEQRIMLGNVSFPSLKIVPITDNVSFTNADTYASHTPNILTGGGALTFSGAAWSFGTPSGAQIVTTAPAATWTFAPYAGGTTIYGWMMYYDTGASNILRCGDLLATPFAVPAAGGSLTINVTDTHKQC
jgi:hypothetical protein